HASTYLLHDCINRILAHHVPSHAQSLLELKKNCVPSHTFGLGNDRQVAFQSPINLAHLTSTYAMFLELALPLTLTRPHSFSIVSSALYVSHQNVALRRR